MSGLTIHGAHGHDVWLEIAGDLYALTELDIARMRAQARVYGSALRWQVHFDEADITALTQALDGPQLWDCSDCEGPALTNVDGRELCPGCAAGHGHAEADCEDAR